MPRSIPFAAAWGRSWADFARRFRVLGLALAMARRIQPHTRHELIPRAFGVAIGAVFVAQAVGAICGHPV